MHPSMHPAGNEGGLLGSICGRVLTPSVEAAEQVWGVPGCCSSGACAVRMRRALWS